MKYLVVWEINVEAETAHEAAVKAREAQGDDTIALVFNTINEGGNERMIDLLEDKED